MKPRTIAGGCLAAVAVVAVAAVGSASATATALSSARSPSWRIFKVYSLSSGVSQLESVDAVSASDAWLAGETLSGAPGLAPVLVQRWTHGSWLTVPVPASADPGNLPLAGDVIAASSEANAWLFTSAQGVAAPFAVALGWNGHRWRRHAFSLGSVVNAAAVFGPGNVWAFGSRRTGAPFGSPLVTHYDGKTWHMMHAPLVPLDASALSPTDMWIVGPKVSTRPGARFAVARWDGHAWQERAFPRHLRLPKGTSLNGASILATSRSDLWIACSLAGVRQTALGLVLLHLTANGWSRVRVPFPPDILMAITRDGRGGIELTEGGATANQYFLHYARGRWTRQLAPSPRGGLTQIQALSWAPGAPYGWAAGNVLKNGSSQGALLRS